MSDGDDRDDGDDSSPLSSSPSDNEPQEREGNSQEEFINSDEFCSSIPIDPDQPGLSMYTYLQRDRKD
jgi:hypothetical protein